MSAILQTTTAPTSSALRDSAELAGRILLAMLFLVSGVGKISAYEATADYMNAMGVPGALLPIVIAFEVAAAAAIMIGWRTRLVAFLLAGFSLVTAVAFHSNFGDQIQMILFLKNVSIAGGFLLLVAHGAGRISLDTRAGR